MSVLIKGVKMPQNCAHCELFHDEGFCIVTGKSINHWGESRNTDCPLIELPDHGDLIDRDEAADDACLIWGRNSSGDDAAQEIIEHLRKMNAVIPAERSEDGQT